MYCEIPHQLFFNGLYTFLFTIEVITTLDVQINNNDLSSGDICYIF